jgi:phospholipid/cholesterol/gamma-HCH transport system substrate-binding protein
VKRESVNYVMVGGFVLLMFFVLLYALYRVTGHKRQQDIYYTNFVNVGGIAEGSVVTFEGYAVGNVVSIAPVTMEGKTHYRLKLNLKSGWHVPDDSTAVVSAAGLLAAPVIEIRQGQSAKALAPGAEIRSADAAGLFQAMSGLITELSAVTESGIKPLVDQLNLRVGRVGDTLEQNLPGMMEDAKSTLARLNRAAATLESLAGGENRDRVASMLKNADQTASNLAKVTADLERTRVEIDKLLADSHGIVAGSREDIRASLSSLRQAMQRVNGVLYQLEATSRNMNEFSRQLRSNPSTLIQGRPPAEQVEAKP